MQKFKDIAGIGPKLQQLLDAAGFSSLEDLRGLTVDEIQGHIEEANRHHELVPILPPPSQIESWLEKLGDPVDEGMSGINYEDDPDVIGMLEYAPVAEPVSSKQLMSGGVSPLDIAEPIYLSNVMSEVEIRVGRRDAAPRIRGGSVHKIESTSPIVEESRGQGAAPVDVSRVRRVEEFQPEGEQLEAIKLANEEEQRSRNERVKLLTTTREETNKGRKPGSRRFIRGVLHPLPARMLFGAFLTILVLVLIPISLLAGGALFLSDVMENSALSLVPGWVIVFPCLLPVAGLLWLFVAPGCRCRVCGQKIFLPKNCLKHRNAHKLPLIGYIFPTAVHILCFKWFRCIFCGTPIRLRE